MWTRSHIIILTIICPRMRTSRTFDRCNCRHFCLGIDVRMSLINIENPILKWLQYCIHCIHCVHKLYTLHTLCKICILLPKMYISTKNKHVFRIMAMSRWILFIDLGIKQLFS
jgi:hypothetical protein